MPVLETKLNARSADFQANAAAMRALVDDLKLQVAKAGDLTAKDAARDAAERARAEVIQVIGRTFTLYRENPDLKRGELPPWRG